MNTLLVLLLTLFSAVNCQNNLPAESNTLPVSNARLTLTRKPLFVGKPESLIGNITFQLQQGMENTSLRKVIVTFTPNSQPGLLASLTAIAPAPSQLHLATSQDVGRKCLLSGDLPLQPGLNTIQLLAQLKEQVKLVNTLEVSDIELIFSNQAAVKIVPETRFVIRPAILVRGAGQDQVHTYRIPGLITTAKGTLIAVYDNRYLASGDLQGDIDVGMSRSTDGGKTWEPMKPIMDMGTFNGLPQNQNGIGDPSLLFDPVTGTIWVAALWVNGIPGQSAWNGSKPGLQPGETGQLMLVRSDDDGITWSSPINITSQCKKPEWHLFFQGPGRGITLADGTLVFPAQFKDAEKTPFSTIIYSKDHGKSWKVGIGAKSNTTEAQVVQLQDGSLMLNMRDDRNRTEKGDMNGRAVAITRDLGQTWETHPSSNSALPESNCMASILSVNTIMNESAGNVLVFSNPNDKNSRAHMTIKASLDQGCSWPSALQTELNSEDSYGYSCLTMVDAQTIGILYEGTRELYFQQVAMSELLGNLNK